MKTFALLFGLLSFSAFAAEIPLYTIRDAERYELSTLKSEFKASYESVELSIRVKKEYEMRGHPEMNIDYYIARSNAVSFGVSEVVANVEGVSTVCATIDAHTAVVTETGACKVRAVVNGDQIDVSLLIK